jgi:hypothetical protein
VAIKKSRASVRIRLSAHSPTCQRQRLQVTPEKWRERANGMLPFCCGGHKRTFGRTYLFAARALVENCFVRLKLKCKETLGPGDTGPSHAVRLRPAPVAVNFWRSKGVAAAPSPLSLGPAAGWPTLLVGGGAEAVAYSPRLLASGSTSHPYKRKERDTYHIRGDARAYVGCMSSRMQQVTVRIGTMHMPDMAPLQRGRAQRLRSACIGFMYMYRLTARHGRPRAGTAPTACT